MARWSFMPHTGDWREAKVLQTAQAFNHPLWTAPVKSAADASLPPEMSFVSTTAPDVIITGVKKAEDDKDIVVRFYEAYGKPAPAALKTQWKVNKTQKVNFVEDAMEGDAGADLRGYEIRTLKLSAE
jgi:alpha-mannosidase